MEVRLARLEDAEATRLIYNAEVTGSTVTFDLEPRTLDDQRAWIARHQGPHPAVVAVADGAVAGFGSLSPFRERPAYATTVEDSVYVGADWRGRGVGRALLDELVALARSRGFHTVIARTTGDNAPSIALHRACGFTLVGTEREVGRKFGHWLDVAVLQRML
ncbi:MAG TPA: GNAT family N-acetyltransferase [Acidimicrobiales bacterium]|nr:GNAT family N-acetyltransferase [Acidimicrobiales bacterium]